MGTTIGALTARKLNLFQLTLVLLLVGFSALSYFDRIIMTAAGPTMMRDFGLSPIVMGTVYSAFILGYALFMIPGGRLTDRLGGHRTLALMGICSAVFTGLTTLAGSSLVPPWIGTAALLLVIRFGLGVVTAPLFPACAVVTRNWIPASFHARVQGLVIAGSSLGAAISPIVFSSLLARFAWRTPFFLAALGTALLAAVWYGFAPGGRPFDSQPGGRQDSNVAKPRRPSTPWLALFTNRSLLLLTIAYGALGYFQYIFFFWMYYYFGQVLHFGESMSAKYTAIIFIVEGLMMPLGGVVSDRLARTRGPQFGRRWVPIVSLILAAMLAAVGTFTTSAAAVACFSLAFGVAACCEGPFWATVTEIGGDHVGTASSILNTGAQIGGFFAPILTPLIGQHFGWSWAIYTGAAIVSMGAMALYFVKVSPSGELT